MRRFDYVIVGGGLQGGLIALAVRALRPSATIALAERAARPAGNHTWSFHSLDVPAEASGFVAPLVNASWPGYLVKFPGFAREVPSPYASVLSEDFARAVTAALNGPGRELRTGVEAVSLDAGRVAFADGSALEGDCVIDARGPGATSTAAGCGHQKFLGIEVETERPWPDALPTVMDATVSQDDGYRFTYVLPFSPHRVLIEDTYFSDVPGLDRGLLRGRVAEAIEARGVGHWQEVREESGVLPMPWADAGPRVESGGPLAAGYAGGWFHPATGYSFPTAVRLALAVAKGGPRGASLAAAALAGRMRNRFRFARLLNFLLFRAVVPSERWRVFRRLYREVPDAAMARFYATEFTATDAARILIGWPPPLAPSRMFRRMEACPCPLPSE